MKLVTYRENGAEQVGALTKDGTAILPLPVPDMNTLIETMTLSQLSSAVTAAEGSGASEALADVELLAPIPRPRQDVLCLGMNYKAHLEEAANYNAEAFAKEKPVAVYFSKRVSQAVAPDGFIESHTDIVERLDYEAELERLTKEKKRLEGEVKRVTGKLSNEGFVNKAPAAVVEEEKQKKVMYEDMLAKVTARLATVESKVK